MKTADFYYELPEELIAQDPLSDRAASRLLVIDKITEKRTHTDFHHIGDYLNPGDCLVINNTKVIPARLIGERENTGGKVELLLLKRKVVDIIEEGNRLVKFEFDGIFEEILDKLGQMPLPPYITHQLKDKNMYQTVYAKYEGSAAAPTAGLHFTEKLLEDIEKSGVNIARVTLHVGLGTFRPVKVDDVSKHHMHTEFYQVSKEAADTINNTKKNGGRIICVGTTSCRTIESASDKNGIVMAGEGDTDIFIYPGYRFRVLDGLITNFHLPESTLLMLVSALTGRDNIMAAYKEAVDMKYRFFSFGDAMYTDARRLVYNPDGTYNSLYFENDGKLKISADEYQKAEEEYHKILLSDGIDKAWNTFHSDKWNVSACEEWCKNNSANHRF